MSKVTSYWQILCTSIFTITLPTIMVAGFYLTKTKSRDDLGYVWDQGSSPNI